MLRFFSELPNCHAANGGPSWKRPGVSSWKLFTANLCRNGPVISTPPSNSLGSGAGSYLDENDLWVAAAAIALDAVLVSRDSDFVGIDGLSVATLG